MKTVCIVGAGPAGLVAAKTLLWDGRARGQFKVTIVESQRWIGGLWPTSKDEGANAGLIHPLMMANQSRHTVQFSDYAWEDVADDCQDSDIPEFPRGWQVGQYLEGYYKRYLADRDDFEVQLSRWVAKADPVDGGRGGWHIHTKERQTGIEADAGVFDYLIVASGYFGCPAVPDSLHDTIQKSKDDPAHIPVIHSSQYRDLKTLFAGRQKTTGKVLIAGGQFSGVEIAGTIANHLSSARHSPGKKAEREAEYGVDADAVSVINLIQRPFWVYPLFTSPTPAVGAPPFLPFDFGSYNIRKRPQPLTDVQGHISVEAARRGHAFMRMTLGSDQSEMSPMLAVREDDDVIQDAPPYIGVSNNYLECVREGLVGLSKGKLTSIEGSTAFLENGDKVEDVAAIILATGFNPSTSLSFFPDSVKDLLQFKPSDVRNTVALTFHATHHRNLPHAAFVGYYRSSYWGVMEMQARVATALFVEDILADSPPPASTWYPAEFKQYPHLAQALAADKCIERTLLLRSDPRRTSQFPMGDYLFLMDQFSRALGIPRKWGNDDTALVKGDLTMEVVTAASYTYEDDKADDMQKKSTAVSLRATHEMAAAGLFSGRFVARAVFRSLLGTWKLDRTLTSRLPSHPSGRFVGTAEFRFRKATSDGRPAKENIYGEEEYLYVEDGMFTATGGPSFRATRRYVWRYSSIKDQLTVWFARTDDSSRADYLFHPLEFQSSTSTKNWEATAGHLCIDDFYNVQYNFAFHGVHLGDWQLRYGVKGPKKDYTIAGTYRR
ncbi:pyridine nucleotide-disulfide [Ophiostoma piceae UAMH 11346]|uniref:Pyridine nucleotide-disulfide n=1 Tax=Ophiostoma piceae (strain UAMH 11346) TaxID=1262450 RepID=S3D0V5_OPHP1|nr:pyridine nucleotide-disulfide [Ophiostoma piceae UAMH 11346]